MPQRTEDYFGDTQVRRAYTSDQNEEFFAISAPNSLNRDSSWRIYKRIYDDDQNEISVGLPRLNATSAFTADFIFVWNDRASLTYSND